jgi:hypothetical protein
VADAVAVNGPDTPEKLLVRFVTDRDDVGPLMFKTWLELGSPAGLCLVSAPAVNRAPAGYGHVWVALDALAWFVDPVTGQVADGVAPHDLRTPTADAFAVRGATVDPRNARGLDAVAKLVANEVKHLCGLGRTAATANEPDEPGWQRKLTTGLAACAAAARRWRP